MSTYWLDRQLGATDAETDGGTPILAVTFADRTEYVYCPSPDEYRVTADVVDKAKDLGATLITYPSSWSGTTYEAKQHAKNLGITVMPHNAFFAYLKRKGVKFSKR